jgi:methylated-DNA-protein-cysteine methyltransferase related protein
MVRPPELSCAHLKAANETMQEEANYREQVYRVVRRIPRGRVMTYGQIAEILGDGYTARTVGFAMHGADDDTPWHRVINARGACSTGRIVLPEDKQQRMLEAEGVKFDERGRCNLQKYLWIPDEQANSARQSAKATLFKR